MAQTIHVNGKSNSLVHKGSMGLAKSTIPDVCKTPSPGGPVPIPYPVIISRSADLKKGTKTVKVDGKKSASIKGSEFSRCMGDEPGTAGGVKSSTNMKEATWLLYSFDVKLDGKNACRLSDKMMMNHGNTACLSGAFDLPVAGMTQEQIIACAIWCCDQEGTYTQSPYNRDKNKDCQRLANRKHSCVHKTIRKVEDSQSPKTMWASPIFPSKASKAKGLPGLSGVTAKLKKIAGVKKQLKPDILYKVGDQYKIIDAKFPCPPPPTGRNSKGRISLKDGACPTGSGQKFTGSLKKERKVYPKLKVGGEPIGKKNVKPMTPAQAKSKRGVNCQCTPAA